MLKKIEPAIGNFFAYFNLKINRISTQSAPSVFFEIDNDFLTLYQLAQEKTQMTLSDNILRRQRHYSLNWLLHNILPFMDDANVAECGCWRGLSSYQIASILKKNNFQKKFFIFDSFEGLSQFNNEDKACDLWIDEEKRRKEFACPLDFVKNNLSEFNFIEYKKGWIPCRFEEVSNLKFSFVHIDVDLYQPIRDSLEFFYPRLNPGGIIVLDDYGCLCFPGAKKAVDDFMRGKDDFFLPFASGSAFIMKKNRS